MALIQSKEKDGSISLRVTGYVTKDPYIPQNGKIVLFSVCYAKDKYMDCKVWADKKAGQIAACLEKHDYVAVDGVLESYEKDGKTKYQCAADFIQVQADAPSAPIPVSVATENAVPSNFVEFEEVEEQGELPF